MALRCEYQAYPVRYQPQPAASGLPWHRSARTRTLQPIDRKRVAVLLYHGMVFCGQSNRSKVAAGHLNAGNSQAVI